MPGLHSKTLSQKKKKGMDSVEAGRLSSIPLWVYKTHKSSQCLTYPGKVSWLHPLPKETPIFQAGITQTKVSFHTKHYSISEVNCY